MTHDEHGNCPNCSVSFNGGSIWEHFYKEFTVGGGYWMDENNQYTREYRILTHEEAELAADEAAKSYGATRTRGYWGRQIGIEYDRDRIEAWRCPDCNHEWPR